MPWDRWLFARRVRARLPTSDVRSGPLVSIIWVAPDPDAIEDRIRSLERTAYRPLELVVVAAGGQASARARTSSTVSVRFVMPSLGDDAQPSINAAVEAAAGELVCLLDPAVDPVLPDWLGHLVETVVEGSVGAAPVLLRARGHGLVRARQRSADHSIVSSGIDLERSNGSITPRHMGFGTRYRWDPSRPTAEVPALSAACIVVRRSELLRAGGLTGGHAEAGFHAASIPYADTELACQLRATGGRLTTDHRALAWCAVDEPGPSRPVKPVKRDIRDRWVTRGDGATFLDRWGPRIVRQVLLDVITGVHRWSVAPLRIVVVGAIRLPSTAGTGADWRVVDASVASQGGGLAAIQADVVVVADPEADIRESPTGLIRVAWVAATGPPHLDEYDLVVAATTADRDRIVAETSKRVVVADLEGPDGVDELRRLLCGWVAARRIGIRIGPSSWRTAHLWGDYHFGRSLQRYLERAGHPTRVRLIGDWSSEAAAGDDATIHVFGNQVAHNRPSQVNAMWQISHPDLATGDLYDTYDQVFVASDPFAASMAGRCHVPVLALHQATDPERFYPDGTGPHHELLFVANYRPNRSIVEWLIPTTHDLAIYGQAWDVHGLDPRYHKGVHIPNAELRHYYGSASIVLNDTWEDMRAAGFISNRIYDALACGAFVLSDDVSGLAEEFDGGVGIYRDAPELRAAVDRYLDEPDHRIESAERGRAAVLQRHTFEQRAATLLEAIEPRLTARPAQVSEGS